VTCLGEVRSGARGWRLDLSVHDEYCYGVACETTQREKHEWLLSSERPILRVLLPRINFHFTKLSFLFIWHLGTERRIFHFKGISSLADFPQARRIGGDLVALIHVRQRSRTLFMAPIAEDSLIIGITIIDAQVWREDVICSAVYFLFGASTANAFPEFALHCPQA